MATGDREGDRLVALCCAERDVAPPAEVPQGDGASEIGALFADAEVGGRLRVGGLIRRDGAGRPPQSRADGDPGPLGEFLARAITDTLMRFIVPAVAGPSRMIALAALAGRNVSPKSLRAAAERGRLKAHRDEHGQSRSTEKWVDDYRASRYKRGSWATAPATPHRVAMTWP